jgi:hypothetical protein
MNMKSDENNSSKPKNKFSKMSTHDLDRCGAVAMIDDDVDVRALS